MEMFDEVLLGMAQRHNSIQHLMETFFSFLERKTDFFHVLVDRNDRMGFPPGTSERLILNMFKKYQNQYEKKKQPLLESSLKSNGMLQVHRDPHGFATTISSKSVVDSTQTQAPRIERVHVEPKIQEIPTVDPVPLEKQVESISLSDTNPTPVSATMKIPAVTEPADALSAPPFKSSLSTFNGGVTDRYVWTQSLKDLSVEFDLGALAVAKAAKDNSPAVDVKSLKGRDVRVDLTAAGLLVIKVRGVELLRGSLSDKVASAEDGLEWTIESGRAAVTVHLDKGRDIWWSCVFEGDASIDTSKVTSVKKVDEFDGTTQTHLRKIIHDQKQKQMGLPTSEDEMKLEALKRAWDAEGSPFKGTPFDPSIIQNQSENLSYDQWKQMVDAEEEEDATEETSKV